ncbi:NAD(P)H-dependent glycerol-3-phosphate dehydrogenase [Streptomyces sp. SID5910]|uniref:NAD(P)H-dependent glycerol-3-phosphate dehydrogenase n=1 Tax=Streptomyces sp. SID5910 TaxID=2690312 RepID=UPI001371EDF3|nr:NAD(P)H-dependent glycerol-3-phosphate dehydrogenase [Streptomyces sp. SID5910]MYR40484.1 NAD(P)H-dependent glycerol-3-phosphate dehydrogenase [Streptomyces sp. SID5910]
MTSSRVAVYGAGSWGTAFSAVLADAGREVTLWGRRAELVDAINATGVNGDYLPGVQLPRGVRATTDPAEAAREADIAVLAVSAQYARPLLDEWRELWAPRTVFVSLMKGVELGTNRLMSEVIAETTGAGPDRIAVLSGPNLAREIVHRKPAASVVACADEGTAAFVQDACHTPYFRPYTNHDVVGCELGGAIKNVIALAVGVTDGMGFGDNAKAALVTRGLAEATRLGEAMGADPLTLAGLAGMGDLVATCSSTLSRNHSFGYRLGQGLTVDEARELTKQTAEGVASCEAIQALGHRHAVELPITEAVVDIIHGGQDPKDVVEVLMSRATKPEGLGHGSRVDNSRRG